LSSDGPPEHAPRRQTEPSVPTKRGLRGVYARLTRTMKIVVPAVPVVAGLVAILTYFGVSPHGSITGSDNTTRSQITAPTAPKQPAHIPKLPPAAIRRLGGTWTGRAVETDTLFATGINLTLQRPGVRRSGPGW
jgi:hypothetical protein